MDNLPDNYPSKQGAAIDRGFLAKAVTCTDINGQVKIIRRFYMPLLFY